MGRNGGPGELFAIGIVSILTIFMTLSDRVNQRTPFGISALLHVFGMALLAIFGFTLEVVIVHIVIMDIAGGFGARRSAAISRGWRRPGGSSG